MCYVASFAVPEEEAPAPRPPDPGWGNQNRFDQAMNYAASLGHRRLGCAKA